MTKDMEECQIISEANLGIEQCVEGTTERNATILCVECDYAFRYMDLPNPRQLFWHLKNNHNTGIVRE